MSDRVSIMGGWFPALLIRLAGRREEIVPDGTPDEMIRKVSWRAFQITTAAAAIPGPAGFAALLPEIAALTKIQIDLIYKLAAYHNKHEKVNATLILLIFGNALGVAVGHGVVRRIGERVIVRSLDAAIVKKVAQRIGSHIVEAAARKGLRAVIPFVAAPVFGYFSRTMTMRLGQEAVKIFTSDLVVEHTDAPPLLAE